MASLRSLIFFLFFFFVLSSALDMSIISYDQNHGLKTQRTDEEVKAVYESWLVKHGKAYNAIGEKEKRFEIFLDNLKFIDEHNAENRPYKVGLNKFADLTNEEYRSMFVGGRLGRKPMVSRPKSDRYAYRGREELPEKIDWREKGAVVSVKDQGQCGVPRIFTDEENAEITPLELRFSDADGLYYLEYIKSSRVNINIRQVF